VAKGRREFLMQFPSIAVDDVARGLARPNDQATFLACKIDHAERETHADVVEFHRELLRIRREDAAFRARCDGAVLSDAALLLRFFPEDGDDRLLIVNLGADVNRPSIAEPLLAPPDGRAWEIRWSSEDPKYGGGGTVELWKNGCWRIFGESALVLAPLRPRSEIKSSVRRRTA
jgi:maltooligosyltrehalose trehalohydrolase